MPCPPVFEAAALHDVSALASAMHQNPQGWAGMEGLKAFRFTSALPPQILPTVMFWLYLAS